MGFVAVTDEIYEHILYDGAKHISIALFQGCEIKPSRLTPSPRLIVSRGGALAGHCLSYTNSIHPQGSRFLDVGAPHPLQKPQPLLCASIEIITTLSLANMRRGGFSLTVLDEAGFRIYRPHGLIHHDRRRLLYFG